MHRKRHVQRVLAVLIVSAAAVSVSGTQERSANGQIYGELLPFVGLSGVRFELNGFEAGIWNGISVTGDPETEITGLSRSEHEEVDQAIRADVGASFAAAGIPFLQGNDSSSETRPKLV